MPKPQPPLSVPLRTYPQGRTSSNNDQSNTRLSPADDDDSSDAVHLSKEISRASTPFDRLQYSGESRDQKTGGGDAAADDNSDFSTWDDGVDLDEEDITMPSDLRRSSMRLHGNAAHDPLLSADKPNGYERSGNSPSLSHRRSARFHERDPEEMVRAATRRRYTYAAGFLLVSLVAFAVQTETAVYIQHNLHWNKAYCML